MRTGGESGQAPGAPGSRARPWELGFGQGSRARAWSWGLGLGFRQGSRVRLPSCPPRGPAGETCTAALELAGIKGRAASSALAHGDRNPRPQGTESAATFQVPWSPQGEGGMGSGARTCTSERGNALVPAPSRPHPLPGLRCPPPGWVQPTGVPVARRRSPEKGGAGALPLTSGRSPSPQRAGEGADAAVIPSASWAPGRSEGEGAGGPSWWGLRRATESRHTVHTAGLWQPVRWREAGSGLALPQALP